MSEQQHRDKIFTSEFNVIVALNFLLFLAFQLFPTALPVYASSIGVPNNYLGLISGLLTLAALITRPFAGVFSDKYGRKGILFAGLIVMLVCTAAYAFCPLFIPLLIIRFIQGLGWGCATTSASAIASDVLPRSRFGEGMGYFGLSVSIALAIGPALGLSLLNMFGITVLSLIGTAILVVTLILGGCVKKRPLDLKPDAAPQKSTLLEKGAAIPAITMFFMTCTYGVIITYLALMTTERGIDGVAGFFVIYAVAAIISRPLIGKFIDRQGFTLATGAGIVLMFCGLVLITLAQNIATLLVAGLLFGFGQGNLQTTLQTQAVVSSPAHRRGAANATFYIGFDGGIGAGSLLGGFLVGYLGYTGMFAFICLLPIVSFIIFLAARRAKK